MTSKCWKFLNFLDFPAKIPEFCRNFHRTLIAIVRSVRSLADRTFQPRAGTAGRAAAGGRPRSRRTPPDGGRAASSRLDKLKIEPAYVRILICLSRFEHFTGGKEFVLYFVRLAMLWWRPNMKKGTHCNYNVQHTLDKETVDINTK